MIKNLSPQHNEGQDLQVAQNKIADNSNERTSTKISSKQIYNYLRLAVSHGKDITIMPNVGKDTSAAYYWIKVWTSRGPKEGKLLANSQTENFISALIRGDENLPEVTNVQGESLVTNPEEWIQQQRLSSAGCAEVCKRKMHINGDYAYSYDVHYCSKCKVQYPAVKTTVEETLL